MSLTHPLADREAEPPGAVTAPDGSTYAVDRDGTIDCPSEAEEDLADALEDAWDVGQDDLAGESESENCQVVKSDGEVCGRELPCSYHSDDEE